jgi:hypothetical protein
MHHADRRRLWLCSCPHEILEELEFVIAVRESADAVLATQPLLEAGTNYSLEIWWKLLRAVSKDADFASRALTLFV